MLADMSRWEQIVEFAESTGIELVFGLNGATRASSTTPLDWSIKNTQNFVTYVAEHNAAAYPAQRRPVALHIDEGHHHLHHNKLD